MLLHVIGIGDERSVAVATAAYIHGDNGKGRLEMPDPPVFGPEVPIITEPMQQQQGRSRAVDLIGKTDPVTGRGKHGPHGASPVFAPPWPLASTVECHHNAAQQLIERQRRRNIQYRVILRQNTHLAAPQGTSEVLPYLILRRMSSSSQSRAAPRYALLRPLGRARSRWGRESAVYTPYPFPASARQVGLRPHTGQRDLQSAPFSSCRRQSDRGRCLLSLYKAVLLEC